LVSIRALHTEDFEGFDVAVVDGHAMECLDRVPDLEIKLGSYTVRDTFYLADLSDTYVVLGVQWMITFGKNTTNYQTLEMGFVGYYSSILSAFIDPGLMSIRVSNKASKTIIPPSKPKGITTHRMHCAISPKIALMGGCKTHVFTS
jgi:hypothetical protein